MAVMEQVIDYDESSNSNSRFDASDCSTDAADSVSGTAGTKQTVKNFGFFHSFHTFVRFTREHQLKCDFNFNTTRKMCVVRFPNSIVLFHLT